MVIFYRYPGLKEIPDQIARLDYSEEMYHGLGQDGEGYENQRYRILLDHQQDISDLIEEGEDVVVLADNHAYSLLILKVLQRIDKRTRLHLWATYPFVIEGNRVRREYDEMLIDLDRIKSLRLLELDTLLDSFTQRQGNKGLFDLYDYVQDMLASSFLKYIYSIEKLGDKSYIYDHHNEMFVESDDPRGIGKVNRSAHNDHKAAEFQQISSEPVKGKDLSGILKVMPKRDGHKICEELKKMRMEFAEANGIELKTEVCHYDGPCAGTCAACDRELKILNGSISKLGENSVFPSKSIMRSKNPFDHNYEYNFDGVMMVGREDTWKYNATPIEIPDFLKK